MEEKRRQTTDSSDKKCIPCEGGVQPLSHDEAQELLKQVPEWELMDSRIERTLKFENFVQAMRFANRITQVAEEENHHPDLHISWGRMRIEFTTHAIGGLSQNDFIMAARINKLVEEKPETQAV